MNITGGILNSRKLKTPEYINVKPTLSKIRQGIFNSLSSMIDFQDKKFLDMFSGSGIMAFEAYSRGFDVVACEKDKKTTDFIRQNVSALKVDFKVVNYNSIKFLAKFQEKFDVIYIDPPYDSDLYEQSLSVIKNNNILNQNGIIILEHKIEHDININGFKIIKFKQYSDKQITFISEEL